MAICSRCGATLNPNASFCGNCGIAQAANPGATPAFVQPPAAAGVAYAPALSPPKRKRGRVLKVLGIIFGVFMALVVWGAMMDSGKNGGKGPGGASQPNSEPSAAVNTVPDRGSAADKEGHAMCAEAQAQINEYLKNSIKGIECQPAGAPGGISLVVGYPAPLLSGEDVIRKNALLMTFSLAGAAIARHPGTPVKYVYALDSSDTTFTVTGDFAKQIYTKLVNSELSQSDAREEIARTAVRGKAPRGH
jgi:zinc-ribbon domain